MFTKFCFIFFQVFFYLLTSDLVVTYEQQIYQVYRFNLDLLVGRVTEGGAL
jgi:hypothetical protein